MVIKTSELMALRALHDRGMINDPALIDILNRSQDVPGTEAAPMVPPPVALRPVPAQRSTSQGSGWLSFIVYLVATVIILTALGSVALRVTGIPLSAVMTRWDMLRGDFPTGETEDLAFQGSTLRWRSLKPDCAPGFLAYNGTALLPPPPAWAKAERETLLEERRTTCAPIKGGTTIAGYWAKTPWIIVVQPKESVSQPSVENPADWEKIWTNAEWLGIDIQGVHDLAGIVDMSKSPIAEMNATAVPTPFPTNSPPAAQAPAQAPAAPAEPVVPTAVPAPTVMPTAHPVDEAKPGRPPSKPAENAIIAPVIPKNVEQDPSPDLARADTQSDPVKAEDTTIDTQSAPDEPVASEGSRAAPTLPTSPPEGAHGNGRKPPSQVPVGNEGHK